MATDTPRTEADEQSIPGRTVSGVLREMRHMLTPASTRLTAQWAHEIEAAIEAEAAAGPRDEGLREALKSIVEVLGPNEPEHAGICEGCAVEMGEALDIARAALAKAED